MDWEEVTDGNGKLVKVQTGYIGMLAVNKTHRRLGIGTCLIKKILKRMQIMGCASVTLETEVSNKAAQKLYQDSFGFMREELLVRYYLNWGDAYRLRLWFA
jgi:peptide alpha-N-acetyltransferase